LGTRKAAIGTTGANITFGATGFAVAATSPIKSTTAEKPASSLTAASEPDYQPISMPLVATSSFPDIILQPPQTPPRRETVLDDDVNDSLFTPASKSMTRLNGGAIVSGNSLFSPSPVRHHRHVANIVNTIDGPATSGGGSSSQLVRTGWDLPPSSTPPPTSPISPRADIGLQEEDQTASGWTNKSGPNGTTEKCDSDETQGRSLGTTFKSDSDSISPNDDNPLSFTFQDLGATSDFDPLSDCNFDFSMLEQNPAETLESESIELDIDELWQSLGPVIAQAQTDIGMVADQQESSVDQTSFDYLKTGDDNTHMDVNAQNAFDPIKFAEDLKALFGGCVV
jgi:hypothetical protein